MAGDEQGGDCVICNVHEKGWCKPEFEDLDKCYEEAMARGSDERMCMGKFDTFRKCMSKKMDEEKKAARK